MLDLWNYLKQTKKSIYLYGTGNGADKILDELMRRNISVKGVFASDGFVRDRYFRGFKVISFSDAISESPDLIALLSFGSQLSDVIENIKEISKKCELYAPDVEVIGGQSIFDLSYANEHIDSLKQAYNLLADDLSKKVFENIVLYKLTGKLDYLFEIETDKSEAYSLLNFTDEESYLDIGAYNGDTVKEFIEYTKCSYQKIIAVEPDAKNFKKLTTNTDKYKNVTLINAGISDQKGTMLFAMRGGRNSSVGEGTEIVKESVDSILNGEKISYIKMDVEGQEYAAIKGAQKTLITHSPKLNIAAYHRNEDIFTLPLLINEINPNYKIYMRHHPYVPAWDTNFYVIRG